MKRFLCLLLALFSGAAPAQERILDFVPWIRLAAGRTPSDDPALPLF